MPTTFNVISVGNLADIDTVEGDNVAENAAALVGLTFGGVGNALVNNFVSLSPVSVGGGYYDQDNNPAETFSINNGPPQTFDASVIYNATITYIDGTTATYTAVLFQDTAGNAYLAPEFSANADQATLEAGAIRSITLDSLVGNAYLGMNSTRELWNYVTCFTRGTMIRTPDGERRIEDLQAEDLVETLDNGPQAVRWIGSTTVPAKRNLAPVVFAKGTLGNTRELVVSPQHRMVLSGWKAELLFGEPEVLSAAIHLVNGDTIYRREGGEVEYFHMMFDTHEIVFAEGAAAESFHPGETGMAALDTETREEIFTLFPELRTDLGSYGPTRRMALKAHEARVFLR